MNSTVAHSGRSVLCALLCTVLSCATSPANAQQCPLLQHAKLTANDAAAVDEFGISVAIAGDTAVVGAWLDDTSAGADAGSAYVFVRSNGVWSQQAKLTANDAAAADHFGASVSISSDTIVVGAYSANVGAGAAYVFVRNGTVWSQQAKLTANDAASSNQLGFSVAISGDTVLAGAILGDGPVSNSGAAYVFVRSGTTWTQQGKLLATDGANGDKFGTSVAISGDTALIGAPYDDNSAGNDAGGAYVFIRSGTAWTQQAKLAPADLAALDGFGSSVALDGETAFVSSPNANVGTGFGGGAAYVFTRSGAVWSFQARLSASDSAANDYFGTSVALNADTAVVGAPFDTTTAGTSAGSAYVFARSGTTWTQRGKLTTSDATSFDYAGIAVAASTDAALIGAYQADLTGANTAGAAYVFALACCPGDVNGDGTINLTDIATLLANFGQTGATWSTGDLNGDGLVDLSDLAIALSQYGAICS